MGYACEPRGCPVLGSCQPRPRTGILRRGSESSSHICGRSRSVYLVHPELDAGGRGKQVCACIDTLPEGDNSNAHRHRKASRTLGDEWIQTCNTEKEEEGFNRASQRPTTCVARDDSYLKPNFSDNSIGAYAKPSYNMSIRQPALDQAAGYASGEAQGLNHE